MRFLAYSQDTPNTYEFQLPINLPKVLNKQLEEIEEFFDNKPFTVMHDYSSFNMSFKQAQIISKCLTWYTNDESELNFIMEVFENIFSENAVNLCDFLVNNFRPITIKDDVPDIEEYYFLPSGRYFKINM